MALTSDVKAELAAVAVTKPACRTAEIAAMLRFGGGAVGSANRSTGPSSDSQATPASA